MSMSLCKSRVRRYRACGVALALVLATCDSGLTPIRDTPAVHFRDLGISSYQRETTASIRGDVGSVAVTGTLASAPPACVRLDGDLQVEPPSTLVVDVRAEFLPAVCPTVVLYRIFQMEMEPLSPGRYRVVARYVLPHRVDTLDVEAVSVW
jgi:hypothetical protein